ncbi:MAG: V-type ATPase subunit [Erysipelotrichaceae bacterium]
MRANEAALSAKIKAKFSKHLSAKDYQNLLAKQSVSEVADYLRNSTYYGEYFSNISSDNIRRGKLESILRDSVFLRYQQLLKFAPNKKQDFFKYQIILNECKTIVRMFTMMKGKNRPDDLEFATYHLSKLSKINYYALLQANNIEEFMGGLVGTPYYKVLMDFSAQAVDKINYTNLENALNKYYYTEVKQLVDKFFVKSEQEDINKVFNCHIEIENLTRVYRLKKSFKYDNSYIKSILTPYYSLINQKRLDQFIDNLNADEFVNELRRTAYTKYIPKQPFVHIENYMERMLYNVSRHYLSFSSSAAVALVCYSELVEIEIQNIIEIIEGIRYKTPEEEIKALLIH